MLNATWLETFAVLAETGHFTRAADRLNMTQPGVSQHLRKLEGQVGQPLITQDGKSFHLTAAGEAIRDLARSRRAEELALCAAIVTDDPDVGEVRIACSGSFAMLIYPHLLAAMRNSPSLMVHLEAAPRDTVLAGVIEGRFDLGLVSADPGHPRILAEHIGKEELCLVLPADAVGEVTFEALEHRGFVAHPDGFAYANELLTPNFPDEFSGADRLRLRSFINQIGQIPAPIAAGIGYTLLPRSGIDTYADRERLRVVDLLHRRRHDIWLISRRTPPPRARHRRIAVILRNAAAEIG